MRLSGTVATLCNLSPHQGQSAQGEGTLPDPAFRRDTDPDPAQKFVIIFLKLNFFQHFFRITSGTNFNLLIYLY
jgi:hypothetical protein